jgi:hypothetical protein
MDKKLKLNAKMNVTMTRASIWMWIADKAADLQRFTLNQAIKAHSKEFDVISEMLNEDYPEDYKNDLREILKIRNGLA